MQKPISIFVSGTAKQILPSQFNPGVAIKLFEALNDLGYEIGDSSNSRYFISINHNRKDYYRFIRAGGSAKNAILIRREPQAVHPIQYRNDIESLYGLILSPGAISGIQKRDKLLKTPYIISPNPNSLSFLDQSISNFISTPEFSDLFMLRTWLERRYFLSLVASNKVSPAKLENYSLRRDLVWKHGHEIEVFGQLWGASVVAKILYRISVLVFSLRSGYMPSLKNVYGNMFRNYPGCQSIFEDKFAITRNSRFSLVIENDSTCITEKLFDAFFSGSIPIYLGPELSQFGIPDELYLRIQDDFDSILSEIKAMEDFEIQTRLTAIFDFISSPNFCENWSDEKVFTSIALEIHQYIAESR